MSTLMIDNTHEMSWGIPVLPTPPIYSNDMQFMHAQQPIQNMHALQPLYNVHSPSIHSLTPAQNQEIFDQMHAQNDTYGTSQAHALHVPCTSPFKQQLSSNNGIFETPSPMSVEQNQTLFSDNNHVQQHSQNQNQKQQQFIDGNDVGNFDKDILALDENLSLDVQSEEENLEGRNGDGNGKDKSLLGQSLVLGDLSEQNLFDLLDMNDEIFQTQDSFGLNVLPKYESQGMRLT
eukprot:TRINITY_DN2613_c2_g1_i1.p1 TRINITY_DN2613_c2_g1~~TRINITY_DN2613_c2_g1_i1.p1  ORF type:complete len:261 (-),score=43.90 TRINITY_DN2613_c2_g1_i1:455-1153(-)